MKIHQTIIGILILVSGVFFYLYSRGVSLFPFIYFPEMNVSLFQNTHEITQSLPSFIHVFAFSIISAEIYNNSRRSIIFFPFLWGIVNIMFEYGQKLSPDNILNTDSSYMFNSIVNYFSVGTYDSQDVLAIILGVVSSIFFLLIINKRSVYHATYEKK